MEGGGLAGCGEDVADGGGGDDGPACAGGGGRGAPAHKLMCWACQAQLHCRVQRRRVNGVSADMSGSCAWPSQQRLQHRMI